MPTPPRNPYIAGKFPPSAIQLAAEFVKSLFKK
jgi:hypothetical protein